MMTDNLELDRQFFKGKRVLVTGAAGTIGRALVSRLLSLDIDRLYGLDNIETEIFYLETQYKADARFVAVFGDIRDYDKLHHVINEVQIVFHGAALKHVTVCERAPFDAVQTNIIGVKNLIDAALASSVERVIFMSSDKAVNPTNVMGTSKLMGERLITAANSMRSNHQAIFSSTRFGNVLGSRGSVVELFKRQIEAGGPITITDPAMTRFVMSPQQAVDLVIQSSTLARGGEVFVTKMQNLAIADLANVMVNMLAPLQGLRPAKIEKKYLGSRPGEKFYEELLSEEETRRTIELVAHFVVLPAFRYIYDDIEYVYPDIVREHVDRVYRSDQENLMTQDQIQQFLLDNALVPATAKIAAAGDESAFVAVKRR